MNKLENNKEITVEAEKPSISKEDYTKEENSKIGEKLTYAEQLQQVQLDARQQKLDAEKENQNLRKKYAEKLYDLIEIWLMAIFFIIIASGLSIKCFNQYISFNLSDKLIITLITTTTTISILGLFVIAMKWLFKSNSK